MTLGSQRIQLFAAAAPKIAVSAYIAPGAALIGDVTLCDFSSVWFQTTLRADINRIVVGPRSNIQDGAVLHLSDEFGTILGERVTVGHCAVLHACTVDDEVLVGMNAVVLDGARIGARSIIGANALVTGGTIIPPGSLVLGSPAKVIRQLSTAEQAGLASWADRYVTLSEAYRNGVPRLFLPPLPPIPKA